MNTIAEIKKTIKVNAKEATAIVAVYNSIYGTDWTVDDVENDYQNDYLSIHTSNNGEFAHYFDGANECGVWLDDLKEMTKDEIEEYFNA